MRCTDLQLACTAAFPGQGVRLYDNSQDLRTVRGFAADGGLAIGARTARRQTDGRTDVDDRQVVHATPRARTPRQPTGVTTTLAPIRALRHRTRLARERAVLPTENLASDYSVPMGLPVHPHQRAEPEPQAARPSPALRAIAGFEALKGIVALAAGLGFLSLLHQDLHRVAASLIGHIGLDPGGHYPTIILNNVDKLLAVNRGALLLAASAYVLVRFLEAYGLWNERPWGEWLGALSGALYVPFELRHLIHSPTLATAAVVVVNIAVVGFLAWQLRQRGLSRAARGAHP